MPEFNPAEWIVDAQMDRHGQIKLTITETTAANSITGSAVRFPPELTARVERALRAACAVEVRPGDPEPDRSTRWTSRSINHDTDSDDSALHWDAEREGWTWGTCYREFPWDSKNVQQLLPATRTY